VNKEVNSTLGGRGLSWMLNETPVNTVSRAICFVLREGMIIGWIIQPYKPFGHGKENLIKRFIAMLQAKLGR
jgi:hypothetical protein